MLERPKLADDLIAARLNASYDLRVLSLAFLPVGNDARAWSYRVETASGEFFLKLRAGPVKGASLVVPRYLRNCGIASAVAPLPAKTGHLYARINDNADFAMMLYPYIPGESGWDMSLSAAQWRSWGTIMRSIHEASIPIELAGELPREIFGAKWLDHLARIEAVLTRGDYAGAAAANVARIWRDKAALIENCRNRYIALGARLAARPPRFVLCHADIHPANIIIDGVGALHIVDWDDTLLAPKERDLMFFIDDGRALKTTEDFFTGYGDLPVDPLAIAYYKLDWVMQEFADYGERVFLSRNLGPGELTLAQREFARLFETGDVVDRAQHAFARLDSGGAQTDAKTG